MSRFARMLTAMLVGVALGVSAWGGRGGVKPTERT